MCGRRAADRKELEVLEESRTLLQLGTVTSMRFRTGSAGPDIS